LHGYIPWYSFAKIEPDMMLFELHRIRANVTSYDDKVFTLFLHDYESILKITEFCIISYKNNMNMRQLYGWWMGGRLTNRLITCLFACLIVACLLACLIDGWMDGWMD
jgi:hypothetical protein